MDPTSAISSVAGSAWAAWPEQVHRPGPVATHPAQPLQDLPPLVPLQPAPTQAPAPGSFSQIFTRLVEEVNAKQIAASDTVHGLISGENVSLHQAVVAMEEAGLAFQLMVEVRNRMLESYQELMRMQI